MRATLFAIGLALFAVVPLDAQTSATLQGRVFDQIGRGDSTRHGSRSQFRRRLQPFGHHRQ